MSPNNDGNAPQAIEPPREQQQIESIWTTVFRFITVFYAIQTFMSLQSGTKEGKTRSNNQASNAINDEALGQLHQSVSLGDHSIGQPKNQKNHVCRWRQGSVRVLFLLLVFVRKFGYIRIK